MEKVVETKSFDALVGKIAQYRQEHKGDEDVLGYTACFVIGLRAMINGNDFGLRRLVLCADDLGSMPAFDMGYRYKLLGPSRKQEVHTRATLEFFAHLKNWLLDGRFLSRKKDSFCAETLFPSLQLVERFPKKPGEAFSLSLEKIVPKPKVESS